MADTSSRNSVVNNSKLVKQVNATVYNNPSYTFKRINFVFVIISLANHSYLIVKVISTDCEIPKGVTYME